MRTESAKPRKQTFQVKNGTKVFINRITPIIKNNCWFHVRIIVKLSIDYIVAYGLNSRKTYINKISHKLNRINTNTQYHDSALGICIDAEFFFF